jgi:hypothetical protein
MKKVITFLLLFCLSANSAFADCDWNTGITPGPNKTFVYSEACHLAVGQLVQTNKTQAAQIQDLNKAISLKDLALQNADARIALWETTAGNMQDRLVKMDSDTKTSDWTFFALGVGTVVLSGFMTARLIGR